MSTIMSILKKINKNKNCNQTKQKIIIHIPYPFKKISIKYKVVRPLLTPTWLIFHLHDIFPLLLRIKLRKHLDWRWFKLRPVRDHHLTENTHALIINEINHLPFMKRSWNRLLIKLIVYSFLLLFTAFKWRKVKWSHWSWAEFRPGSRK